MSEPRPQPLVIARTNGSPEVSKTPAPVEGGRSPGKQALHEQVRQTQGFDAQCAALRPPGGGPFGLRTERGPADPEAYNQIRKGSECAEGSMEGGAGRESAPLGEEASASKTGKGPEARGGTRRVDPAELALAIGEIDSAANAVVSAQIRVSEGIREVQDWVQADNDPSWVLDLLKGALTATIGATCSGLVGMALGKVLEQVVSRVGKEAAKAALGALSGTMSSTIAPRAQGLLFENLGDAKLAFFHSQSKAMSEENSKSRQQIEDQKKKVVEWEDPFGVAKALLVGARAMEVGARELGKKQSLEGWLRYLAQTEHGVLRRGGTDLEQAVGEGAADGTLHLRLALANSGLPRILEAELEGISKPALLQMVGRQKLGELKIPIVVTGDLPFPFTKYPNSSLEAGRNEDGVVWFDDSQLGALFWLAHRAGEGEHALTAPNQRTRLRAVAKEGANRLMREDLTDLQVGEKLKG